MRRGRNITINTIVIILFLISLSYVTNAIKITQDQNTADYIIVDKNSEIYYNSIQKAVDNAKSGSKIYIKNGEYNEIIDVYKPLSLIGEDKKGTLINPISEKNKYAIKLGAPNIVIKNLKIVNRAPGLYSTGIKITSSNIEVDQCEIYDTPVGIAVWESENIIKNSNFVNCEDEGIALLGWKNNECNNNKILNCNFYKNCDGIELQYSSYNLISNCKFFKNTHTGIDAIASSNNNNKIIDCEIIDNMVNGIYLSSSSYNEIIDCEIRDNLDGNIVMNKYSKNNQIIESIKENVEDESNEIINFGLIKNLFNKIPKIKNSKIFSIFNAIGF